MLSIRHVEDVVGDFLEAQTPTAQILLKNQSYVKSTKLTYPRAVYGVAVTRHTARQSTPLITEEDPNDPTQLIATLKGDVLLEVVVEVFGDPLKGDSQAFALAAYNRFMGPFREIAAFEEFRVQSMTPPIDISAYVETKVEERWRFTITLSANNFFQYTIPKMAGIEVDVDVKNGDPTTIVIP